MTSPTAPEGRNADKPAAAWQHKYGSYADLEALPDGAVVIDVDQHVWQHLVTYGSWVTPGIGGSFPVEDIKLPAWLLDDGL